MITVPIKKNIKKTGNALRARCIENPRKVAIFTLCFRTDHNKLPVPTPVVLLLLWRGRDSPAHLPPVVTAALQLQREGGAVIPLLPAHLAAPAREIN